MHLFDPLSPHHEVLAREGIGADTAGEPPRRGAEPALLHRAPAWPPAAAPQLVHVRRPSGRPWLATPGSPSMGFGLHAARAHQPHHRAAEQPAHLAKLLKVENPDCVPCCAVSSCRRPAVGYSVHPRHPRRRLCHLAARGRPGAGPGQGTSAAGPPVRPHGARLSGNRSVSAAVARQQQASRAACRAALLCPSAAHRLALAYAQHAQPLAWSACSRTQARESLDRSVCWPSSWVAREIPEARLLSIEYAAPVSGWEVRRAPPPPNSIPNSAPRACLGPAQALLDSK